MEQIIICSNIFLGYVTKHRDPSLDDFPDVGKWPIKRECNINYMFSNCPIEKETFEGKLYGNKIAEYFGLDNPNELLVSEP